MKGEKPAETGELRQDLITGKWVVIATGRAKRPNDWKKDRPEPRKFQERDDDCPFCRLDLFFQKPDVLRLPDDPEKWQVHIFGNLYPAFSLDDEFKTWATGPYRAMEAIGYHEILATRQHNKIDARLTEPEMELQIEALVLRYRQLMMKPAVSYIQIIKNHGELAGGSLEHPHHQILTVPVLPSDVKDMLDGAQRYAQKFGRDPFGVMVDFEIREGVRLIAENDAFVAFCPYASRVPFEVWVVPREHNPFFENLGPKDRRMFAQILQNVLAKLYRSLNDPPYNYYIHSAPCDTEGYACDNSQYGKFRWHAEILPRLNVWGGFELGTGLEITTASPEESAAYLRR